MDLRTISVVIAAATISYGCTTTIVASSKTKSFDQPVAAINIVYVESALTGPAYLPNYYTQSKANSDRQGLGLQILQHLPDAFSSNGVSASGMSLQPASIPSDPGRFRELFPETRNASILFVVPISAVSSCPAGCFHFRLRARLVLPGAGQEIWTALIDLPPKASRFHDFEDVAKDFSSVLVAKMIKDGVVGKPSESSSSALKDKVANAPRETAVAKNAEEPRAIAPAANAGAPREIGAVTNSDQVVERQAVKHKLPPPPATNFARIDDVRAVPKLSERGRELYREYLKWSTPKAVAISESGAMARGWNHPDAMALAIERCEKFGKPCRLYAVDNIVVWSPASTSQQ